MNLRNTIKIKLKISNYLLPTILEEPPCAEEIREYLAEFES